MDNELVTGIIGIVAPVVALVGIVFGVGWRRWVKRVRDCVDAGRDLPVGPWGTMARQNAPAELRPESDDGDLIVFGPRDEVLVVVPFSRNHAQMMAMAQLVLAAGEAFATRRKSSPMV